VTTLHALVAKKTNNKAKKKIARIQLDTRLLYMSYSSPRKICIKKNGGIFLFFDCNCSLRCRFRCCCYCLSLKNKSSISLYPTLFCCVQCYNHSVSDGTSEAAGIFFFLSAGIMSLHWYFLYFPLCLSLNIGNPFFTLKKIEFYLSFSPLSPEYFFRTLHPFSVTQQMNDDSNNDIKNFWVAALPEMMEIPQVYT